MNTTLFTLHLALHPAEGAKREVAFSASTRNSSQSSPNANPTNENFH